MTHGADLPALRVEQALRLLPDVDALAPLRAFLVGASRAASRAEPYRTVGKRVVPSADLRQIVPRALGRVTEHLGVLYEAAVVAIEAEQRGDLPAVVEALLRAGAREERVGRESQARAWYDHGLRVGEGLRDRRPEVDALLHLGRLESGRGRHLEGARFYQRALVLADAERNTAAACRACQGLGYAALANGQAQGAESWFTRALRYAEPDRRDTGQAFLGLAEVARRRGRHAEAADRLRSARAIFEEEGDNEWLARTLGALGRLEGETERHEDALRTLREALARVHAVPGHPGVEMNIRLTICRLYLDWGRFADAEDEIRRAEDTAIALNATRFLARLYVVMGRVLGRQGDETGFVFFEKAVELCRGHEPDARLEAEVYREYARFRGETGEPAEARAYLERAREILDAAGDQAGVMEVQEEIDRAPPA